MAEMHLVTKVMGRGDFYSISPKYSIKILSIDGGLGDAIIIYDVGINDKTYSAYLDTSESHYRNTIEFDKGKLIIAAGDILQSYPEVIFDIWYEVLAGDEPDGLLDKLVDVWNKTNEILLSLPNIVTSIKDLKGVYSTIVDSLNSLVDPIIDNINNIPDIILTDIKDSFDYLDVNISYLGDWLLFNIKNDVNDIIRPLTDKLDDIKDDIKESFDNIPDKVADKILEKLLNIEVKR